MRLIVKGDFTSLDKSEARYAAQWAARELLGKRLSTNIQCTMIFKDMGSTEYGNCLPIFESGCRPRKFRIEVASNCSRRTQLVTQFHEMKHLAQIAREELRYSNDVNIQLWRKALQIDSREYDYSDLPWEREAYRMQDVLYMKYKDHLRLNQIQFS